MLPMVISRERAMWSLFEPIHVVTYFAEPALAALTATGLRGFWRGYFAGRAAPLGPVSSPPVLASFFSFAPAMVTRALPSVWGLASPEQALEARAAGSATAIATLAPDAQGIEEAAELLEAGIAALEPAGRVLGAANQALPAYAEPRERLWQACTTLREHRGDGHNAALVAANIGPLEALALRTGMDLTRERVQPARGWTDEEWTAAQARLTARGLLDSEGRATPDARDLFASVEAATDAAAAAPWVALGPEATRRVATLLLPIAEACATAIPPQTPIGMKTPTLPSL